MTDAEFLAFNDAWMAPVLPSLCGGGVFDTFIDWRGSPPAHFCSWETRPDPPQSDRLDEASAGIGGPYRSQHELPPLFTKGPSRTQ
jgi:hypothetical protein